MSNRGKRYFGFIIVVIAFFIAIALGLCLGIVSIPIKTVLLWIGGGSVDPQVALVLDGVRLPRLIVGVLCGASLAMTGAAMQVWTANPLAGPGLLGLNGGASAALALTVTFIPWLGPGPLILVSLLGAASGGLLVLATLYVVPASEHPLRLVLVGAMVSAFLGSITATLIIANGMQTDLLFWMVGGLGTVGWREVMYMCIAVLIGIVLLFLIINELASVALGDSVSRSLGVNTKKFRFLICTLVVLLAGASNAIAGPIGFVGFLSPHLARRVVGPDPRPLLPLSAIIGAILVVYADSVGRVITPPDEQPLGLFVAIAGAPALIIVTLYYQRRNA